MAKAKNIVRPGHCFTGMQTLILGKGFLLLCGLYAKGWEGERVLLACSKFGGQEKRGVSKERMFRATFSNLGY